MFQQNEYTEYFKLLANLDGKKAIVFFYIFDTCCRKWEVKSKLSH
jgi:hypothetical protein